MTLSRWEQTLVRIMQVCRENKLTAHTTGKDPLFFRKKKPVWKRKM
jgi:hypothetical protein